MIFFRPNFYFDNITKITPDFLKKSGVDTLFLDIDNTIKPYGVQDVTDEVRAWLMQMKKSGIRLILCSNNYKRNVQPFAQKIGLDAVHMCLKPSPFGVVRAKIKTGAKRKNILVCGDQAFTDIFGARICFLKSALIEPIDTSNESWTVKLRRYLFEKKGGEAPFDVGV